MQSRALELLVGFFFCLGVAAIFILTFKVASVNGVGSGPAYRVVATFENIGGLKNGSAVTLAGVKIGRVRDIVIDRATFEARATLEIAAEYDNIPKDTIAKILTAGLLGEQYVGLEPGGDEQSLKDGDTIRLTQSAVVLENLIGQFLAGKAQEGAK
ncbi:MAG: outer membrane lipid asymmetry maintenance protein MlaD [Gammaproteobacteria bacterium]|nr:outer membrane lipid asymmetry maintenance protein MlaD [Gammaproteobacteria bacterium]